MEQTALLENVHLHQLGMRVDAGQAPPKVIRPCPGALSLVRTRYRDREWVLVHTERWIPAFIFLTLVTTCL